MAQGKESGWDPFVGSGCFQAFILWSLTGLTAVSFVLTFILR